VGEVWPDDGAVQNAVVPQGAWDSPQERLLPVNRCNSGITGLLRAQPARAWRSDFATELPLAPRLSNPSLTA
jgi:hypothetical protein